MMQFRKIMTWFLVAICISIMACQSPVPDYNLDALQGSWVRVESTDSRSDSMELLIENDSAVITYLPSGSGFILGQKKWTSITSIADRADFELFDVSADSNSHKAIIQMKNNSKFKLTNEIFPQAPGAEQTWIRK